jgi:hypothetical protein
MRVLLLHPEDFPLRGRWARQRWDLIVDLGKSSPFSEAKWSAECRCAVLRSDSLRRGIEDVKQVRTIFSAARGRLIDEEGIDWWDLASLLVVPEALTALALMRVASEIAPSAELWSTRPGWPGNALGALLRREVHSFQDGRLTRSAARVRHYAGLARRFPLKQIKEIFLDKYDSGYRWRARFASKPTSSEKPVVLLPTAYKNVSRMAAAYARLLPQQSFLMVATRQSAKQFVSAINVQVRDLAGYAGLNQPTGETESLVERWNALTPGLCSSPGFQILFEAGVFDSFPAWIRDGLCARDAWRNVLEREPVCGVLCGDDSNLYTRLPVLLAARRKIPTVDFHHGAFDGRYLLKELPCDVYLAKNEMEQDYLTRVCGLPEERITIGAAGPARAADQLRKRVKTSAIFFSEPYESEGMRAHEVYREVLPVLCRLAGENGHGVILKLHPFESRGQRCRMLGEILTPEEEKLVTVVDGPLSAELLSQAWFAVTVESTAAVDCVQAGVCCFLCKWLTPSAYEYVEQYARFGVGEVLEKAEQLYEIEKRLEDFRASRTTPPSLSDPVDPVMLQQWLTGGLQERALAALPKRSAS